jgi:hypothetical protein
MCVKPCIPQFFFFVVNTRKKNCVCFYTFRRIKALFYFYPLSFYEYTTCNRSFANTEVSVFFTPRAVPRRTHSHLEPKDKHHVCGCVHVELQFPVKKKTLWFRSLLIYIYIYTSTRSSLVAKIGAFVTMIRIVTGVVSVTVVAVPFAGMTIPLSLLLLITLLVTTVWSFPRRVQQQQLRTLLQ